MISQPAPNYPDTAFLLGAKIISVNMEMDVIESIVVLSPDGTQHLISGASYINGPPEIEVETVQHPIKPEVL